MEKNGKSTAKSPGIRLLLEKGPFQNNGASPWFSRIGMGSPEQKLKFSFDTGSDFIWTTSSLCDSDSCKHFGKDLFHYSSSTSFSWINQGAQSVDFGPWGTMQVESGNDVLSLVDSSDKARTCVFTDIYLAKSYTGQQFEELDWDGGIGIPSQVFTSDTNAVFKAYRGAYHGELSQSPSFHFFQSLVDQEVVSSAAPYVTFLTDNEKKRGEVRFGNLNEEYRDSQEYLFLPWEAYYIPTPEKASKTLKKDFSVSYIWTSPLRSFSIGETSLISEEELAQATYFFSLDSGSSQFKGDPKAMQEAYALASRHHKDVTIELGVTDQNEVGRLVIPSSVYDVKIEEGTSKGEIVPQFAKMEGLINLVLVGSVLMDHLYTVYEYTITAHNGENLVEPVGMWVFNKPDGPKIIQTKQNHTAGIFK